MLGWVERQMIDTKDGDRQTEQTHTLMYQEQQQFQDKKQNPYSYSNWSKPDPPIDITI